MARKTYNRKGLARPGDEQGFVLITAMLFVVVLTFIGLASIQSTSVEQLIAANDRSSRQVLYRAEGAAYEAAQRLENETDAEQLRYGTTTYRWLHPPGGLMDPMTGEIAFATTKNDANFLITALDGDVKDGHFADTDVYWASRLGDPSSSPPVEANPPAIEAIAAVEDLGVVRGEDAGSLLLTNTTVHAYVVYARAREYNAGVDVAIGYRKRF